MGICSGKSNSPQLQRVEIGGPDTGLVKWVVLQGKNIEKPQEQQGWEMKFNLNSRQEVSGGTNDKNIPLEFQKQFVGKFSDGQLEVTAYYGDGSEIKYDGLVEGGILKVKCKVIKSGSSGYYHVNDIAECIGPILYK